MYNDKQKNRYDIYLVLLVTCLCFGNLGGALQVDRILAILLAPAMLSGYKKAHYPSLNILVKGLFAIYIYIFISLSWTPDYGEGIKEIVYYPVHFLIILEIIVFSRKAIKPLDSLSIGWLIMVLLCSIVAIWEITTGNHLNIAREQGSSYNTGMMIIQRQTASATFINYNTFVTILCFSFPWIFYSIISEGKRFIVRVLSFLALIVSSVVIFLNASRGGTLAIILMVMTYALVSKKARAKNIIILFLLSIVAFAVLQYVDTYFAVLYARTSEGGMFADEARSVIWSNALKAFSESLGFGVGVGGLSASIEQFSGGGITVTHNLLLEVLVQYGVVIFLSVFIFLWSLFKESLKSTGQRRIVLLMSFFAMPAYFIIDSMYLLSCSFYVLIATIFVFVNYDFIRRNYQILRSLS